MFINMSSSRFASVSVTRVLLIVTAVVMSACSSQPTGYQDIESTLSTRGGWATENGLFHDVVYNPESIGLTFPGYIVGLDKGDHGVVLGGAVLPEIRDGDTPAVSDFKARLRTQPKLHYISHVVRNTGERYGKGNCLLYSVYRDWGGTSSGQFSENDGDRNFGCNETFPIFGKPGKAFPNSWIALDALRSDLKASLATKRYTHAIVIVMGWNTPQTEAIRNFNSILSHLHRAATDTRTEFNPLVVGVTWASMWSAKWAEPMVALLSYRNKADDADEIGLSWLAEVVRIVQETTAGSIPSIAIGHSFGARALATALCAGSQISPTDAGADPHASQAKEPVSWNLFIGWEGAFSIGRFAPGGATDGFTYAKQCGDYVGAIVLTSSKHDTAVTKSMWADTAGSAKVYRKFCADRVEAADYRGLKVKCIGANQLTAEGTHDFVFEAGAVNYVDASNIVIFNQPNTGGGAHSDVFRPIHGRFSWAAIRSLQFSPPKRQTTMQPTAAQP